MINRITPDYIKKLAQKEIFVFGSNQSGRHGKGAAKTALGAGVPFGAKQKDYKEELMVFQQRTLA